MTTHVGILPVDFVHSLTNNLVTLHGEDIPAGRFLKLPHPRTGLTSLFLPFSSPCGTKHEILEVQAVEPVNPRSWFIGESVLSDGKLLVMTRVDPAFLLLPILQALDTVEAPFRPADDLFEEATRKFGQDVTQDATQDLNIFTSLECTIKALKSVCEFKEITVYRYSPPRVVEYLRTKVDRLATTEVLETSRTLTRKLAKDGLFEDGKEDMLQIARIRLSCDILSQYLSPSINDMLIASYNFTEYDRYLQTLEVEVAPGASGDGKAKAKAKSEDKKRKAKGSQGVERLKKVNVDGMAKISKFFSKKT